MIQVTRKWCSQTGLILNPKKSGILEFLPNRKRRYTLQIGESLEDIPIVSEYKYLGLVIDQKLTGRSHINKMQQKIQFLTNKLIPLLGKVSVDYRINLWKILVKPLFKPGLGIMYQNSASRIVNLERCLKKSLKRFTGLSIQTPNSVLAELINVNVDNLAQELSNMANAKWYNSLNPDPAFKVPKSINLKAPLLPRAFAKYNNLQFTQCKQCDNKSRNTALHLRAKHGMNIPSSIELIQILRQNLRKLEKAPQCVKLNSQENY